MRNAASTIRLLGESFAFAPSNESLASKRWMLAYLLASLAKCMAMTQYLRVPGRKDIKRDWACKGRMRLKIRERLTKNVSLAMTKLIIVFD